jgi:N-acetylneuraminic acid mutarotase
MRGSEAAAGLVLLFAAGCVSTGARDGVAPAAWRSEPSLQYARSAHAVATDGSAIYVVGGSGAGHRAVLELERFDGVAWVTESTLPGEGLNAPAAAIVDGRLYVIGGFHGVSNLPSDRVLVYDLRTRRWSEAAPLPAPRGGHAAVVASGRIHVFGGGNDRATLADHDVYDPQRNRWQRETPLPRTLGSPAGVVGDGRIWSIGGRSGRADYGSVYRYEGDAWVAGPDIDPRGTAGAVLYRGAIHVFGGESQARGTTLGDVLRLDPATQQWQLAASLPSPRAYARTVVFRERVFVVGGDPLGGASHSAAGSTLVESYYAAP